MKMHKGSRKREKDSKYDKKHSSKNNTRLLVGLWLLIMFLFFSVILDLYKIEYLELFEFARHFIHVLNWCKENLCVDKRLYLFLQLVVSNKDVIWQLLGNCSEALYIFSSSFFPVIMDAFFLIWGAVITLTLFLIENRKDYWYGVSLRRIVNLSFTKRFLKMGSGLFILLCPTICVSMTMKAYITALLGIIYTFLIFILIPISQLLITRKEAIIKLLCNSTIDQIKGWDEKGITRIDLEELSITSMIEHVEYNDIAEIKILLNTLEDIFVKGRVIEIIRDTMHSHVVLMGWIEKIIESCGLESYSQRERIIYILRKIWEKLTDYITFIQNTGESNQGVKVYEENLMLSCSAEVLLPLVRHGTSEAEMIFKTVWNQMGRYKTRTALYLLLYIEYLQYEKKCYNCLILDNFLEDLFVNLEELQMECRIWNKELALEFWLCWTSLWDDDNNIAICFFLDFQRDILLCAEGKFSEITTTTMRKIVWKVSE